MSSVDFRLGRDRFGRLTYIGADGERHDDVVAVRAFPLAAADEGIALVGADGHEVAWIERLGDLAQDMRSLIEDELGSRDFMPEILQVRRVSSFATPSTWAVRCDRGETSLVLKGEEDIRRLGDNGLLISDSHGIQFRIRNLAALDKNSRRLLDRFL
jgi:hypothetical protein